MYQIIDISHLTANLKKRICTDESSGFIFYILKRVTVSQLHHILFGQAIIS